MKKKMFIAIVAIAGLAILFYVVAKNKKTPVILGSSESLLHYSVDALIKRADLIVIGEVKTTLPSKWNGSNGSDPKNASPEEIVRARGLFTDSLVFINQTLKGDVVDPIVRVRSFIGETENVRWVNESEPSFVIKKTYLLFLAKDIGATAKVEAGDYVSVGAFQGAYEIIDGKAISKDDEWVLEELIVYIQKFVSDEAPLPTLTPMPCGQPISRPLLPNSTGNPLGSGEEVSIADARRRIFYPIPLPELEESERVWISTNPENPSQQSVAICFKRDLLLIIHKSENQKPPDWDKTITIMPVFKKIDVNGNSGMGVDPGVLEFHGQPYAYPGSVEWWVNGLDITLYSDTLPLEELLNIAETVH